MIKKRKALQVSALLSAVTGATLILAANSSTVSAAPKENCWDQQKNTPLTRHRYYGCYYDQYGLSHDGGGIKTRPDITPGPGPGPDPGPPYTS